ncbi:alanine racemase [Meinhardsimonia xiamenensis]|jgi:alanine racemase|uniref:Alanine racemase n=1 Tax=Meinhardsimonia xiamenensis TaxID=990712 RepID=A0A1G9AL97_9RHOB|nr:alanine racemase [Meinhardsimonia xiamenensis]PRX35331.1 alanine racemase [Meinhardsimonia xiamenensis]SDK28146.1 alanine racemase [Meinhardsimonia xiamenensis]
MAGGHLDIDLDAIVANWRALDALSAPEVETGVTIKADAYGLGAGPVAEALAEAGAGRFFIAQAEEGEAIREAVGPGPLVYVYSGHMEGDTEAIGDLGLIPVLNSIEQMTRHFERLPRHPFAIQLDTGMNRLGMEPAEWLAVRDLVIQQRPHFVMSHLACADEPEHPMNARQLALFRELTEGLSVPRSLAATGGILLGPEYHFDITRPGIGLYGGLPFEDARPVVVLSLPVIQTRSLEPGETVGYANTWEAEVPTRLATVSAGYADGLMRALSNRAMLFADGVPCPLVGRVSMDLITVDITHLDRDPETLEILCPEQSIDDLAAAADTIGYEILTALGNRYTRRYRRSEK